MGKEVGNGGGTKLRSSVVIGETAAVVRLDVASKGDVVETIDFVASESGTSRHPMHPPPSLDDGPKTAESRWNSPWLASRWWATVAALPPTSLRSRVGQSQPSTLAAVRHTRHCCCCCCRLGYCARASPAWTAVPPTRLPDTLVAARAVARAYSTTGTSKAARHRP